MSNGFFAVISGGEGSGKTSVLQALAERHPDWHFTREPGGTEVGQKIREILLSHELDPSPWTELFLFFADRAEHLQRVVEPKLREGKTVMSDRYWMDTFAYQWRAAMHQDTPDTFFRLIEIGGFRLPDLWIYLDIEPAVGLARRRGTGKVDRLDAKDVSFHQQVWNGFHELRERLRCPVAVIDAHQPLADVTEAVAQAIQSHHIR